MIDICAIRRSTDNLRFYFNEFKFNLCLTIFWFFVEFWRRVLFKFLFQMFYYILAVILVLSTSYWFQRKKNLPPGPLNLPIFGYLLSIDEKAPHETFTKLARKFGPVYSLQMGNIFAVVLSDAKIVRKVFSQDIVTGRPELYLTHGIMNGYGKYYLVLIAKFAQNLVLWPTWETPKYVKIQPRGHKLARTCPFDLLWSLK